MAGIEEARVAKAQLASALAGRDDVRGIGIRRLAPGDDYELQVNLSGERGAGAATGATDGVPTDGVPAAVRGVGVHVRVVGALHAQ
ncbi:hypothetical protein [Cellulomonas marina]|uniref:Uncharacterized protein n=1 Tax=Cellulomonas marina TaxID=988821 RepID=A0A1I0YFJ0_9CELL|nr:hypothetical protein [Cellulomonas marina]GIG28745.1 hypothetical protein Cma02nite_13450 [Cellulomonas marina]SFB11536.1 hypothetical protein SAMN05421867_10799 [Cellulomonas marina]